MAVIGALARRLGAMLYDGLLLLALWFAATAIWLPFTGGEAVPYPGLLRIWILAISFVFLGWFWTHGGQTLGLRAWKLKLVRADGAEPTWRDALNRFVLAIPSIGLAGLGLLWMLVDREHLAIHDRGSGTRLVRT